MQYNTHVQHSYFSEQCKVKFYLKRFENNPNGISARVLEVEEIRSLRFYNLAKHTLDSKHHVLEDVPQTPGGATALFRFLFAHILCSHVLSVSWGLQSYGLRLSMKISLLRPVTQRHVATIVFSTMRGWCTASHHPASLLRAVLNNCIYAHYEILQSMRFHQMFHSCRVFLNSFVEMRFSFPFWY